MERETVVAAVRDETTLQGTLLVQMAWYLALATRPKLTDFKVQGCIKATAETSQIWLLGGNCSNRTCRLLNSVARIVFCEHEGTETEMSSLEDEVPELEPTATVEEKGEEHHEVRRVPVTVITGFLGSGKTTLLNYILTENHGKRIAVIENEFGEELGIESAMVVQAPDGSVFEECFQLSNGCICCSVR